MKKYVLIFVVTMLFLPGCQNQGQTMEQPPSELIKIKKIFSTLYSLVRQEELSDSVQAEEAIAIAASENISSDADKQKRFCLKVDYYFKEILQHMESVRVQSIQNTNLKTLAQQLDSLVNLTGHELNQMNLSVSQEALNKGIDCIGKIFRCYDRTEEEAVLHLEYCLNLLEIEAENEEKMSEILDLTEEAISELDGEGTEVYHLKLFEMKESLQSLRDAVGYHDPRLVRMKVGVMRENFEDISVLVIK